uniref:PAS domain S-box protein n=1 Tax=Methylotetracoccus oryzae TaxID=1919059 RepID=UPI00111B3541
MMTLTSSRPNQDEPVLSGCDDALLRAALDAGDIGLWAYDHAIGHLSWSTKVREMLGSDAETPVEVHPDDSRQLAETLLGGGSWRDLRIRLRRQDGQWLWVGCSGRSMDHDDSGRPLRSAGTVQDISATMHLESRLAEQEERLRLVTDTITEVFYIADAALDRIFFVSPAYERIWGRPVAELYANPRSFLDAVHPEDLPAFFAALTTHLVGEPLEHEYRILGADGSLRWIWDRGFPVPDASGVVTRYVGLAQDITRRKLAEAEVRSLNVELEDRVAHRTAELEATAKALADSEQRYRTIVESVQEGIWMIDAEARTSFTNRKAAEMLGYTPDEMAGRSLFDFMDETWQRVARGNLRRRADGIVEQHEFRFRRKDGSALWALMSTAPIRAEDGGYAGALATLIDIGARKQAEDLNRKLAGIIEATSDLIATATPDGQIEYMNRAGRALLGIAEGESLADRRIEDCYPPWAYRRIIEEGVPAMLTVDHWLDDTALLARDGTEIPVSQLILAHKDRDTGQLELISTICRDMRAHLRADEALRQLQQEQELILDSMPAMIFYKDTANRVLRVNARVAEALGLPKNRIEGRHSSEFFPNEAERYFQDDLIVIRTGQPRLGIEEPIRVAAHEVRWLSTDKVPLKDAEGKVTGLLVMASDITDRKLADEALRHSQEDLSRAQALGKIGSWRLDPRSASLTWSAEAHRIFGTPEDAPMHYDDFLSAVHPDDRDYVDRMWQAALRGEPYAIEHRIVVDGHVKWVSEKAELGFDAQGPLISAFGTVQDITDRKLAEAALQDADRRKDEFIATLAHELRNPMAPIGNAVQILQTAGIDDPTRAWCCQLIERQVEHLTKLVDELLDISRITRGKISLDWQSVAVGDIVERALESCRPLLETSRHQLDLRLPSVAVHVGGDPVRLAQVVSNLLNNAAKYTEPGGHITLTVEHGDAGVTIRVRDDGIGIPPALLSQVFEMFSQGDQSLEKTHGGLGIGLSLARELVALHHGSIQAYSAGAGQGSEFVVWLPAAAPPSEP